MPRMNPATPTTRLQDQYQRLYLPPAAVASGADTVRALVLALRQPADWDTLAPLWRGVQADLAWPAPAIAVNGADAFELWFSLAQPVPRTQAAAVLRQLCQRYLPSVKPDRLPCWPSQAAAALPAPEAGRIPALHPTTGRWSAFVAPDLPAVFGDDPSLDFPPNEDAQAELLSRLGCIQPSDWQAAVAAMQPANAVAPALHPVAASAVDPAQAASPHPAALAGPYEDPRQFLRDVMNTTNAPLALRLEAAKALLG